MTSHEEMMVRLGLPRQAHPGPSEAVIDVDGDGEVVVVTYRGRKTQPRVRRQNTWGKTLKHSTYLRMKTFRRYEAADGSTKYRMTNSITIPL